MWAAWKPEKKIRNTILLYKLHNGIVIPLSWQRRKKNLHRGKIREERREERERGKEERKEERVVGKGDANYWKGGTLVFVMLW